MAPTPKHGTNIEYVSLASKLFGFFSNVGFSKVIADNSEPAGRSALFTAAPFSSSRSGWKAVAE